MNEKKRIVITGCGVVAPNGIGTEAFWHSLKEGKTGIKAIDRFDCNQFQSKLAGEIQDFKAEDFLGSKGLRDLDRTTRFLCSAAKMALDDSGLAITEENSDSVGVCTATTLSSLWNVSEFSRQIITDGPQFTDAALFPGTVANAASSWVSIKNGIRGFNVTISNGFTSGLDALKYSADAIRTGQVDAVVLGGAESISPATYTGFSVIGLLAGIKGEEVSCPFDKRRNGIILSEGAAVVVLEELESAKRRKARILAEVKGTGSFFDAYRTAKYHPQARGLSESIRRAVGEAGLPPESIDMVSAAANSLPQQDALETMAIKEVFGKKAAKLPVSALKSMIGETFSAAGIMQIVAVVGNLRYNFVSPTLNYHVRDPECDLDYVPNSAREAKIKNALIDNFGPGGSNSAAVLSRFN